VQEAAEGCGEPKSLALSFVSVHEDWVKEVSHRPIYGFRLCRWFTGDVVSGLMFFRSGDVRNVANVQEMQIPKTRIKLKKGIFWYKLLYCC
jgi:hypothetical protein